MSKIILSQMDYWEKLQSRELVFAGVDLKTSDTFVEDIENGITYKVLFNIDTMNYELEEVEDFAENN